MDEKFQLEQVIDGKDKYYSGKKFVKKIQNTGLKLGYKGLYGAATLFTALKSPEMSTGNKLLIAGVLGYFILPTDLVADILPMVGLTDDILVIGKAISVIYNSITDDMKEEAHELLKKMFGEKYQTLRQEDI